MLTKLSFIQCAAQTLSLLISLVVAAGSAQSQSYSIKELKPLQGGSTSNGLGINANGHIAGMASSPTSAGRGAYWTTSAGVPAGTGQWGNVSSASTVFGAINNASDVAGYYNDGPFTGNPLYYSPSIGQMVMLPVGDFHRGEARSVNDLLSQGDYFAIAGTVYTSYDDKGSSRAALWKKNREMLLLPTLDGGEDRIGNQAWSISNLGFVGGSSAASGSFLEQAVVWSSATGSIVARLNGPDVKVNRGAGGRVHSVKDNRYWCGYIYLSEENPIQRACFWPNLTECHELGTLGGQSSLAFAVRDSSTTRDNRPEVVGTSQLAGSVHDLRAFVYDPAHGMHDLNSLIPANSGWLLQAAFDIDPKGRIIGVGLYQGQTRGFLLNPVLIVSWMASSSALPSLQTTTGQIEMLDEVPSDTRIVIRASSSAVSVPSSIVLKRGQQRASFPITAAAVRERTDVTITLFQGEQEISTRVTVTP